MNLSQLPLLIPNRLYAFKTLRSLSVHNDFIVNGHEKARSIEKPID